MKVISIFSLLVTSLFVYGANGCGMITHMEASLRAIRYFSRNFQGIDIRELVLKHQDAFQTGAVFPDAFYAPLCLENFKFADISKLMHGMDYIKIALDYIKQTYLWQKPMSEDGEKFFAFVLGNVAHVIQDRVWHGYGIDQGFLNTLAQVNFNGSFEEAHSVGDFGGDAVSLYEFNYIHLHLASSQWYVPTETLLEVLAMALCPNPDDPCDIDSQALFKAVMLCPRLTMARALLHKALIHRFYIAFAMKAPMLVSPRFTDYFLGGMNDMASWTMQRFETALRYLENGKNCTQTTKDDNPMYWMCGDQPKITPPPESWMPPSHAENSAKHLLEERQKGYMAKMFSLTDEIVNAKDSSYGSDDEMVEQTKTSNGGGHFLRPKGFLRRTLQDATLKDLFEYGEMQRDVQDVYPPIEKDFYRYYVKKAYSLIGQSMVSVDINNDGADDLVVGVPGYSEDNRFDEGRVYVVKSTQRGLPSQNLDFENSPDSQVIPAPFKGAGRFGYSIVALDFNGDSLQDLVISAPIRTENIIEKPYSGFIYVYYGQPGGKFKQTPDVKISCDMRYCNYGATLSSGDVNRDGKLDLIIGSPYASRSFESDRQNGFVSVFYAGKTHKPVYDSYREADVILWGIMPYSWFGHSAISTKSCDLLVGAPGQKTAQPYGEKSQPTMQMSGVVYCYSVRSHGLRTFARGSKEFEFFGATLAEGYPNGRNSEPVVAIGAPNSDNMGQILGKVSYVLRQSGTVYLFNVRGTSQIGQLIGDRLYGSFGQMLNFVDVDRDQFDDLIVGSPTRSTDISHILFGEGIGELYLYYGRNDFPKSALARTCESYFSPCPATQADGTFSNGLGDRRGQLGSKAVLLRAANVTQLVVATQRSDEYARLSGKLLLFNNCLLLA